MIIGVSGYLRSGKDEVGKIIQRLNNHFEVKKFAGKLKRIASLMTGIPVEKFEDQDFKDSMMPPEWGEITVRQFLVDLGTKAIRNVVNKNAWVISAMVGYSEEKKWIFTDCRFPNEAQAIKDKGGVIIRVNREVPGVSQKLIDRPETETSLDDWDFDYVIENMGTLQDLENQVKEILRKINQVNLVTR